MKKLLVGVSTVAVLGIGSLLTVNGLSGEETPQTEAKANEVVGSEAETKSVTATESAEPTPTAPQERTVAIGENYPWQFYTVEKAEELVASGEVLFLESDADALNVFITDTLAYTPPEESGVTKQESLNTAASFVGMYVNQVGEYSDNDAYISKLNEIKSALNSGDVDAVNTLISE